MHSPVTACTTVALSYLATLMPDTDLGTRRYAIKDERISAPVHLVMLSDLHSTFYGQDQQELPIGGIYDKNHPLYHAAPQSKHFAKQLQQMSNEKDLLYRDLFSILLSHRPSTELLADSGYDLIFFGHIHSGQVRIPGVINGLYAPSQGLIPSYAGGLYTLNEQSTLIVGRGLVRSHAPRIFNPPKIVYVELLPA